MKTNEIITYGILAWVIYRVAQGLPIIPGTQAATSAIPPDEPGASDIVEMFPEEMT